MTDYKPVNLSTKLVEELEDIANSKNTDIDNTVKLLLIENKELKNPSYLTTTKVSKNKSTYSSVIPAPIKNKFNLSKGQVLYWDIEENKIIITPEVKGEDLPETPSIEAGYTILTEMLEGNPIYFTNPYKFITRQFGETDSEDTIINNIIEDYKSLSDDNYKRGYKLLITYMRDQPLDPVKMGILEKVENEIKKLD